MGEGYEVGLSRGVRMTLFHDDECCVEPATASTIHELAWLGISGSTSTDSSSTQTTNHIKKFHVT